MARSPNTTVDLVLIHETDGAYKTRDISGKFVWVPKSSRVTVDPDPNGKFPCEVEMSLPEDLAEEKGLV